MARHLFLTILIAAMLGACAPAVPAVNPTQAGATGLAAANSMLTQTRAATTPKATTTPPQLYTPTPGANAGTSIPVTGITSSPTAADAGTALPVTADTPLPTDTLGATPLPLTGGIITPTISTATLSGCNHALDIAAAGPKVRLMIKNDTQSAITLNMGFGRQNAFGQCGYISWPHIGKGETVVADVPRTWSEVGGVCYWAYALIQDAKTPHSVSDGGFCLQGEQTWVLNVKNDRIRLSSR